MRLTTLLRRLLGVKQMYVKQVEMAGRRRSVDGVGGAVVAACPVRDVREAGAAV